MSRAAPRARWRELLCRYPELVAVVLAAAIGLSVRTPLRWLTDHDGINLLLALLVFSTALTIDAAALRGVGRSWRLLIRSLVAGVSVLPALAWLASRLVSAGSLRDGVLTVGLAPCEIASVATTAMAGGDAALAAAVLIGSTVAAVACAGPLLLLEVGSVPLHPAHIVGNLALVVALPLAAGLLLRSRVRGVARAARGAATVALGAVAALVALIAAEVQLSSHYLGVGAALVAFVGLSALLGRVLAGGAARPAQTAVLLTVSMRDFAIAAGIASAAFGAAAAAPLGLYGVLVLLWGTAVAGTRRHQGGRQGGPFGPSTADRVDGAG